MFATAATVVGASCPSPFIDPTNLPSMICNTIGAKYGAGANWARMEVCKALASALINDFGFVSTADLEMKVQTYIDNGYVAMLASQLPSARDPYEFDIDVDLGQLIDSFDCGEDGEMVDAPPLAVAATAAPMTMPLTMPMPEASTSYNPPQYQVKTQQRGEGEDKFFCQPNNNNMVDNATLINTLNYGTDEEVCALPNLSCSCPAVKLKCDVSCESILFVHATHTLMTEYGVSSLSDVYKYLGMLGDRKCVWCKEKTSSKISCVSGTFQCINCLNKYKRIPFAEGFKAWLDAGCPAKHAVPMNVTN